MRERVITLDRHLIQASDSAKATVLERERILIQQDLERQYKKKIQQLEANILAYQDLVITKEVDLKRLEKKYQGSQAFEKSLYTAKIQNLEAVIEEKIKIIEQLKAKGAADWCEDYQSDDELTNGTCTRAKLGRRVFKKID